MDEQMRTIWCGNLSEKVTEEILYELFLQGGPVQRVSIPKHRDGRQRTYGFVTYKHINSVSYALSLFDGTMLFNRPLSINTRNGTELPQTESTQDQSLDFNHMLQLGQQMILGHNMPHMRIDMLGINTVPRLDSYSNKLDVSFYKDERRSRYAHPYRSAQNRDSDHHHHKNHRSRSNHNSHHFG